MVWIIIGSVISGLILIYFILCIIAFFCVFYSPLRGQNSDYNKVKYVNYNGISAKVNGFIEELLKLPHEDLYIDSYDGLKLHAYLYRSEGSKEYVMLFHGYRRTARRNFCGLALDLLKEHKNVILVDERGHGLSKGHRTTFGKREQYDVASWTDYVVNHFEKDSKITIGGVSLGAASVLMASDKIDEKVKIIADSPYYSIEDAFKQTIRLLKLWVWFFYPIGVLTAAIFCHMSLKGDLSLPVYKSKNKILIIHSTSDKLVSYKLSEKIYLENKDHVELALFDGDPHGFSYLKQTDKYREIYFAFLNK